jgi:hypothetical protein
LAYKANLHVTWDIFLPFSQSNESSQQKVGHHLPEKEHNRRLEIHVRPANKQSDTFTEETVFMVH